MRVSVQSIDPMMLCLVDEPANWRRARSQLPSSNSEACSAPKVVVERRERERTKRTRSIIAKPIRSLGVGWRIASIRRKTPTWEHVHACACMGAVH